MNVHPHMSNKSIYNAITIHSCLVLCHLVLLILRGNTVLYHVLADFNCPNLANEHIVSWVSNYNN